MDVEKLDRLFREYGYDVKETNTSYRVYLLNQGMYHGAEIQIMNDVDIEPVLTRYSKLGYHAKSRTLKPLNKPKNIYLKVFLILKLQLMIL